MIRRILAALMLTLGFVLVGVGAAQAPAPPAEVLGGQRASDAPKRPVVAWPMRQSARDRGDMNVVIQAPRAAKRRWGMARAERTWDRRLPDVRLRFGNCRRHPHHQCVRVRVRDYGPTRWGGVTRFHRNGDRSILLNRHYRVFRSTSCHELGHALGLSHHRSRGCIGPGVLTHRTKPSRIEVRTLRRTY